MKGEIVDISTWEDEFKTKIYKIVVEFKETLPFKLGKCEVKNEK